MVNNTEKKNSAASAYRIGAFQALLQEPQLPTGCEITSLTSVLNFCGYGVSKIHMAKNVLTCDGTRIVRDGKIIMGDPEQSFIGSPFSSEGLGCYAPVIVKAANSYLGSVGSSLTARNITGSSPEDLYALVLQDRPVIVWASIGMEAPYPGESWNTDTDGRAFQWLSREHCLVLIGRDASTVTAADPLKGIVSYDRSLFEMRYGQFGKQAVVVCPR